MSQVTLNTAGLRSLQAQLVQAQARKVHVGLLAETAGRVTDKARIDDNPSLGLVHEFGNPEEKIPERSFLRMPLMLHLGLVVATMQPRWFGMFRQIGVNRFLGYIGHLAEDVIQEAFATRGFGTWKPLQPATVKRKGSSAVLIETAQMRKAITSKVV